MCSFVHAATAATQGLRVKLSENVVAFIYYLGMAIEDFKVESYLKFTMVMYHLDNGQRSYNSQTKLAERMILPSSSQKFS